MSKAWSKDIWVDPGTFGGSPACHVIADMMNKNVISVYEKHRVLSFITDAIYQFKWTSSIKDKAVRERAMNLMRNDLLSRIDKMDYQPKFLSYLRNVIAYHYRRFLEEAA